MAWVDFPRCLQKGPQRQPLGPDDKIIRLTLREVREGGPSQRRSSDRGMQCVDCHFLATCMATATCTESPEPRRRSNALIRHGNDQMRRLHTE